MKQFYLLLFLFVITACSRQQYPEQYQAHTTEINADYEPQTDIETLVAPYKAGLEAQMNTVIGEFAHDMYKKRPESELGNFMCDGPLWVHNNRVGEPSEVDLCFMNYGGIRTQHIPAGNIIVEQMFELMPFENELVIMELTGEHLKAFLDRTAQSGGWPVSMGVKMVIGEEEVKEMTVFGEPLDYSKTYRIMLSDYVANGGDGMEMLKDLPRENLGIKVRDILIDYCKLKTKMGEKVSAEVEGRVTKQSAQEKSK